MTAPWRDVMQAMHPRRRREVLAAAVASFLQSGWRMQVFRDRRHAGQLLAHRFEHYLGDPGVIVLALPRGGVPVGYEIARRIGARLDVLVVRKLGVPGYTELAMGAIASDGILIAD